MFPVLDLRKGVLLLIGVLTSLSEVLSSVLEIICLHDALLFLDAGRWHLWVCVVRLSRFARRGCHETAWRSLPLRDRTFKLAEVAVASRHTCQLHREKRSKV
jgi:hypothetical protein